MRFFCFVLPAVAVRQSLEGPHVGGWEHVGVRMRARASSFQPDLPLETDVPLFTFPATRPSHTQSPAPPRPPPTSPVLGDRICLLPTGLKQSWHSAGSSAGPRCPSVPLPCLSVTGDAPALLHGCHETRARMRALLLPLPTAHRPDIGLRRPLVPCVWSLQDGDADSTDHGRPGQQPRGGGAQTSLRAHPQYQPQQIFTKLQTHPRRLQVHRPHSELPGLLTGLSYRKRSLRDSVVA